MKEIKIVSVPIVYSENPWDVRLEAAVNEVLKSTRKWAEKTTHNEWEIFGSPFVVSNTVGITLVR